VKNPSGIAFVLSKQAPQSLNMLDGVTIVSECIKITKTYLNVSFASFFGPVVSLVYKITMFF
jgi:hypothetical protein